MTDELLSLKSRLVELEDEKGNLLLKLVDFDDLEASVGKGFCYFYYGYTDHIDNRQTLIICINAYSYILMCSDIFVCSSICYCIVAY